MPGAPKQREFQSQNQHDKGLDLSISQEKTSATQGRGWTVGRMAIEAELGQAVRYSPPVGYSTK